MDEEGKGPDQGDFDTSEPPVAPTSADSPDQWPTEPDTATTTQTEPASDQLPTTSGTDPILIGSMLLFAAIAVVVGLVLLARKRSRGQW